MDAALLRAGLRFRRLPPEVWAATKTQRLSELPRAEEGMSVTGDLFSATQELAQVPMQDAEAYYLCHLPLSEPADEILQHLIDEVPWKAEKIVMWGKTFLQPRLTAWHGDTGQSYTYSGIHLHALPWTSLLLDIKSRVETVVGYEFNSVLLNYYRDNRDSMGLHSDDERELGKRPIIASLSLGEERTFILKHKTR